MLRACRRLLVDGGRLAFLTIRMADGLTPAQHREAARSGPPAVSTRTDHNSMLRRAGFADVEETDVTSAYLDSVRAWVDESAVRESELRALLGDQVVDDRRRDRLLQISAIQAGLLRRSLYVAVPA